jgi:NAD(P)-dependent dehydrogenase (short-subunit alcohol dehydrogenase family)
VVDLDGQVAIVTGGGRGIGRAVAHALAAARAAVAVVARSPEEIERTVAHISASGGRAIGIVADVSNRDSVDRMTAEVERRLGPIDLLVNNAAVVTPLGPITEIDPDEWWRSQEINVRGPLLCARAVLPTMRTRHRGRIVNVSSMAALAPLPNVSAYLVSKLALMRLSEVMALEMASQGVLVFAVSPGTVRTDMLNVFTDTPEGQRWAPWAGEQFAAVETPVERPVSLILTIASGAADQLSGRVLNAREDVDQVIARAAEVERGNLYTLRVETLHGRHTSIWRP